jgi:NAD-dependent deacetylase
MTNSELLRESADEVASRLSRACQVAALTGAGISAESGIPTFRSGASALWRNLRAEELATPEAFARDPALVTDWYRMRLQIVEQARPNPGHIALAQIERHLAARGAEFTLVTQNVDGLHAEGGSESIVELHGSIRTWRCTACAHEQSLDQLGRTAELGGAAQHGRLPEDKDRLFHCSCGAVLRPGVVWFGESLPFGAWERAERAATAAEVFIVAGTSAAVYPAAGLVGVAKHAGAYVVEINPEATGATSICDLSVRAPSGEFLPLVADRIM